MVLTILVPIASGFRFFLHVKQSGLVLLDDVLAIFLHLFIVQDLLCLWRQTQVKMIVIFVLIYHKRRLSPCRKKS